MRSTRQNHALRKRRRDGRLAEARLRDQQSPDAQPAGRIASGAGRSFDPEVVKAFFRVPFENWAGVAHEFGVKLRESDQTPR